MEKMPAASAHDIRHDAGDPQALNHVFVPQGNLAKD
jgi:hypothetical protein